MAPLKISIALWDYDRVKAIEDGRVQVEGCDVNFLNYRVEETFFRQLRFQEFDVCELSLSSYVLTLNNPDPPFIAIPVFPSRFFRHQSIYIHKPSFPTTANSPNPDVASLKGKKVGTPEVQMTAPVWERGILEDEYGVPFNSVEYFTGNVEPSLEERKEKLPIKLGGNAKVTPIPKGKCLAEMLRDGEIDCLESATQPSTLVSAPDKVGHLFPNFKEVEKDYYKRTGIFPIMHVMVIKRSVLAQNPWLARALVKAFSKSMEYAYDAIHERGALRYILPWLQSHVDETKEAFNGEERWWQDGLIEGNRKTLDKFLEYSHRQGFAKTRWQPEDLFAKSALEAFVV